MRDNSAEVIHSMGVRIKQLERELREAQMMARRWQSRAQVEESRADGATKDLEAARAVLGLDDLSHEAQAVLIATAVRLRDSES